jgi:hypothetical protein
MADWPAMGRAVLALVARHWGGLPRQQAEQPPQAGRQQAQAQELGLQQAQQQGQQQQGQQQQGWPAVVPQPTHPGRQHVPLPAELSICLSHFLDRVDLAGDATAHTALQQQLLQLLQASAAAGAWKEFYDAAHKLDSCRQQLLNDHWDTLLGAVCYTLLRVSAGALAVADGTVAHAQRDRAAAFWVHDCTWLGEMVTMMLACKADAMLAELRHRSIAQHLLSQLEAVMCFAQGTMAAGQAAAQSAEQAAHLGEANLLAGAVRGLLSLLVEPLPALLPELQQAAGVLQLMERIMQVRATSTRWWQCARGLGVLSDGCVSAVTCHVLASLWVYRHGNAVCRHTHGTEGVDEHMCVCHCCQVGVHRAADT